MDGTNFVVNKEQLVVETSRVFKATPERLWKAHTDPEQIPKWWGPGDLSTVIEKNEVQVDGAWRYVQTAPDGSVHSFHGNYKEVDEPHKLVRTFEYEPMAGHILIETVTFEALDDDTTKMTAQARYDNLEDLDGMVGMGMERGQRESFDRLAVLVGQGELHLGVGRELRQVDEVRPGARLLVPLVGGEIDFDLLVAAYHDDVFDDA